MQIVKYEHHGKAMSVREDLKGKHREHCLCYSCGKFHPEDRTNNCPKAQRLYDLCVTEDVVTPVWECAAYK